MKYVYEGIFYLCSLLGAMGEVFVKENLPIYIEEVLNFRFYAELVNTAWCMPAFIVAYYCCYISWQMKRVFSY